MGGRLSALALCLALAVVGCGGPTDLPDVTPTPTSAIADAPTPNPFEWDNYAHTWLHEAVFTPETGMVEPSSFNDRGSVITIERIAHAVSIEGDSNPSLRIEMTIEPPREYQYYLVDLISQEGLITTLNTRYADFDSGKITLDWYWPWADPTNIWPEDEYKIRVREHLMSGFKVWDLGPLGPAGFIDRKFVGIGEGNRPESGKYYVGEFYAVDLDTGERTQLTDDGRDKQDSAASSDYLAWVGKYNDVFVRDLDTGEERIIPTNAIRVNSKRRFDLDISGAQLTWLEQELAVDDRTFILQAYDLETGETKELGTTTNALPTYDAIRGAIDPHWGLASCTPPEGRTARTKAELIDYSDSGYGRYATGSLEVDLDSGQARTAIIVDGESRYVDHGTQEIVWSENCKYAAWTIGMGCSFNYPIPKVLGTYLYDTDEEITRRLTDSALFSPLMFFHDEVLIIPHYCHGMYLSGDIIFLE